METPKIIVAMVQVRLTVDPDLDISYLRRRGEYNFSSRLAAWDAIPADEKTSFSNNLASSFSNSYRGDYILWINISTWSL